jgi:hypothetical protein
MATPARDAEIQGHGIGFSVDEGRAIHDFEEYTFRAPRPGFFLGDSLAPNGDINPVVRFEQDNREKKIPPCPSSRPYLGALDTLATELLCQICLHLDICSLLAFRCVNRHAKDVVDTFPPIRFLATFPKLLGAIQALQCRSWTVEALLHCVLDERCSVCGYFGDFLYLVTPERWCYRCWYKDKTLGVQRVPSSVISQKEVLSTYQNVPNVRLSEGYYGVWGRVLLPRPMLVFDLRAIQGALPAASSWPHATVEKDHALRYTAVIRAPYWDAHAARFDEGFFCRACSSQGWTFRGRFGHDLARQYEYPIWGLPWRRYTRDGMRDHIDRYGTIFEIQTPREERRYVHEKPFAEHIWEEPTALQDISLLLRSCREKEFQLPQGQLIISGWRRVSSDREI